MIRPSFQDYNALNVSSLVSYEDWRTQYIGVEVFYPQLAFTLIKVTPAMTLPNLIAGIGGSMGLIVGVSFFTILEIGELFVLLLNALLSNQVNSNKVSFQE